MATALLLYSGCRLLSRGVFAVFGSHTVATINTLQSFSAAFRLPFISTGLPVTVTRSRRYRRRHHGRPGEEVPLDDGDYDDQEETVGYEIYMRPQYARAVVDLLKHYKCRLVWYLYNSNEGTLAFRLNSTILRRTTMHSQLAYLPTSYKMQFIAKFYISSLRLPVPCNCVINFVVLQSTILHFIQLFDCACVTLAYCSTTDYL